MQNIFELLKSQIFLYAISVGEGERHFQLYVNHSLLGDNTGEMVNMTLQKGKSTKKLMKIKCEFWIYSMKNVAKHRRFLAVVTMNMDYR